MYKSVIAGYSRSPFTMAKKGELIDIKPVNLLAEVIKNLVSKSKINPNDIEDIVIGCAFQVGEQCFNIGKLVTFLSGIDIKTSATTDTMSYGVSPLIKKIYFATGFLFLILGIIGYIFPIMPGTIFLILSAFCFLKSSLRFYNYVVNNPKFGAPVKDYVEKGKISKLGKIVALGSMWIATLVSIIFIDISVVLNFIAYSLAILGTTVILRARS